MSSALLTPQQMAGLEQGHLCSIETRAEKNILLNKNIEPLVRELLHKASADGVAIEIVSSFRSFDHQLRIWNDKWRGHRPVYSRHGRPLNLNNMSAMEKYKSIALYSALPGMSRHHWGTDFDIFSKSAIDAGIEVQLVEDEFAENGPCAELNAWLTQNLESMGFFRPYHQFNCGVAAEPWHISAIEQSHNIASNFDLDFIRKHLLNSSICEAEWIASQVEHYKKYYFDNIFKAGKGR